MAEQDQQAPATDATNDDGLTTEERELAARADNPDQFKAALTSERSRAKTAERELNEMRARIQEFEDRDRTEAEKLAARAEQAEQARDEALKQARDLQSAALRRGIADEIGLPPTLADRLRGEDEEQLRTDARALAELVKPPARTGGFGGGPRGTDKAPDEDPQSAMGRRMLAAIEAQRART